MKLLAFIGILIGAVVLASSLHAQAPAPLERPFAQLAAGWTRALERVSVDVGRRDLVDVEIDNLVEQIQAVRASADATAALVREELQAVRTVLAPLEPTPGPPGPDGKPTTPPPESDALKAQREQLTQRASELEGRIKQAEAIVAQADLLREDLKKRRSALALQALAVQGPLPLEPRTWRGAAAEAVQSLATLKEAWQRWIAGHPVATTMTGEGLPWALGGALGVAALWAAIRALRRRFGRRPVTQTPSYRDRVVAATVEGLAMVALPILTVVVAVGAALLSEPPDRLARIVIGTGSSISFWLLVFGLTEAALAPRRPLWRMLPFSDSSAQRLSTSLQYFALVLAIANVVRLLLFPSSDAAPNLHAVVGLLSASGAAIFGLAALRTLAWQHAGPSPGAAAEAGTAGAIGGPAWGLGRALLALLLVVAAAATILGYVRLGEALIARSVTTVLLLALTLIVHGIVRDLLEAAVAPDAPTGRWLRRAIGLAADADLRWRHLVLLLVDIVLFVLLALALPAIWGVATDRVSEYLVRLFTGFKIGGRTISLVDVGLAIVVFLAVLAVVRLLRRGLRDMVLADLSVPAPVRYTIDAGVNFVGLTIALLLAIVTLGVDFSSIALILGALSVGIGLGLQNIANNTISGIVLLLERPISVGDWIVVGEHEGIVRRINIRATEIETFRRATVIVPNSEFLQKAVVNWTYADHVGRVDIVVTLPPGTDPVQVETVMRAAAEANPLVARQPTPNVVLRQMGTAGLEFELQVWLGNIANAMRARNELNRALLDGLSKAGLWLVKPPA